MAEVIKEEAGAEELPVVGVELVGPVVEAEVGLELKVPVLIEVGDPVQEKVLEEAEELHIVVVGPMGEEVEAGLGLV